MLVSTQHVEVQRDSYVDSVKLMSVSRGMQDEPGVEWASVVMGTPTNLDLLHQAGISQEHLEGVGSNDLVVAAIAGDEDQARAAVQTALDGIQQSGGGGGSLDEAIDAQPRTIDAAVTNLDDANVAIVSVPGDYAALEAYKALSEGLHV